MDAAVLPGCYSEAAAKGAALLAVLVTASASGHEQERYKVLVSAKQTCDFRADFSSCLFHFKRRGKLLVLQVLLVRGKPGFTIRLAARITPSLLLFFLHILTFK